ncbi:arsenate reductase family protein [Dysgonomonas sp. 520]|uniref:arsenate reductase family protein n=1 Tax=Dysgonomonas sp. 520 TaxID=2302931 RepID=UPI0013D80A6C|nr:arsenate reductase family protein [Dysgonomonas sp. 520]NDW10414.1 arsenate reductase family protein [Dysgonomonas sp. 520]
MSKILFVHYPKCGTCQKAAKWLRENDIEVESRNIVENNPTKEELSDWLKRSGLPIKKFFNTSGRVYKENNIKDLVQTSDDDSLLTLLATDGMLVKRPVVVSENNILIGFNEEEWTKALK